jgi:hypothetical protein
MRLWVQPERKTMRITGGRVAADWLVVLGVLLAVALPAAVGWGADAVPAPAAVPPPTVSAKLPIIPITIEAKDKIKIGDKTLAAADEVRTAFGLAVAKACPPDQVAAGTARVRVAIAVPQPDTITYETLQMVMAWCASGGAVAAFDVGGTVLPVALPRPAAAPETGVKSFRYIPIDAAEDLKKIGDQKADLKGAAAQINARTDAPLALVLPTLKALWESGAGLIFADRPFAAQDADLPAKVVIQAAPWPGLTGGFVAAVGPREGAVTPTGKMKKTETRGKFKPGGAPTILHTFTDNPFPDVATNGLSQLDVIGVGGGGNKIGGFEGLGTGGEKGFFGVPVKAGAKVVYIIDRSGSMTDSIDYVKLELKRSLSTLDEKSEFHVIFYSSGPALEAPAKKLVPATERNKRQVFEFIDTIIAQGETFPAKALERAFELKPDVIMLMTDGEFDKEIAPLIKKLNAGGKTLVNTIGFLYRTGEENLKAIAADNGGQYKFVSERDLANTGK